MSRSLNTLRQTAKEILAAAVLEVFPGTQLIEGGVSEIGFHYDFQFSSEVIHQFGETELTRIEDHMRFIVHERRAIGSMEMMRENAQTFFNHLGQPLRADRLEDSSCNIVEIFKMEPFYDVCPGPFLQDTSELNAFKLLEGETHENTLRISGTAFYEKDRLKAFVKKYREAKKRDLRFLGPHLGMVIPDAEGWIYLPKGEVLRKSLIDQWRDLHTQMGFQFCHIPAERDLRSLHRLIAKQERAPLPYRLAQLTGEDGDFASIFCQEQNLLAEVISSLQFIDQTIKIFGFERRVYLLSSSKRGKKNFTLLNEAIVQAGIALSEEALLEEEAFTEEPCIEFRLVDGYGQGWKGPYVMLDPEKPIVYRSFFGSLDRWVALLIEQAKVP